MSPTLVVLAAGLGSRFGGSKQVAAVGPDDEALLDYAVYDAFRAGFGRVVFVVQQAFADEFHQRIGARIARSAEIAAEVAGEVAYAYQDLADLPAGCSLPVGRTRPWGTAHAVWCARHQVQGDFAVVNADDFYGRDAYVAMVEALAQRSHNARRYVLIGYPVDVTLSEHGAVTRAQCRTFTDGCLADVVERHRIQRRDGVIAWADEAGDWHALDPKTIVSMNFWGFTGDVFGQFEDLLVEFVGQQQHSLDGEFQLPTAVGQLVTRGQCRVDVLAAGREWFGMTYAPDRLLVEERIRQLIRQQHYPAALWSEA